MKCCTKCKKFKPLDSFQKDSQKKDGLRSSCKECDKVKKRDYYIKHAKEIIEKTRLWAINHPDKRREIGKRWKDENLDKAREHGRLWAASHKDENRERERIWRSQNPEKSRDKCRHYRVIRSTAQGGYTKAEWEEKKREYSNCCAYCGSSKKLTVDHIVPISHSGSNYISNIVPACKSCNCSKGNKLFNEWLKIKPEAIPPKQMTFGTVKGMPKGVK